MNQRTADIVLVLEDDVELAELYHEWLSESYTVRLAHTKEEALEKFDESVDIAVLDRRLPRASGDDVLEHIQETKGDCQVAMVTGMEPDFDIIGLGFDAYLIKPVNLDELNQLVSQLLERQTYCKHLQRLHTLTEKRALLESRKDQSELEGSEEYQSLVEEIENLQVELNNATQNLDDSELSSKAFWQNVLASSLSSG